MKKVVYHSKIEREALEYTSKIIDLGVGLLVYAALNELFTAHVFLRQSRFFHHSIKKRANIALVMRNRKVEELRDIVLDKKFADSYWDAILDAYGKDVALLRREIENTLKEAKHPDYELISQVEVARVLLESAKIHYEESIKDCTAKFLVKDMEGMRNVSLFDTFREFYIDNIYREWDAVCKELYSHQKVDIELTNERTTEVYEMIADRFAKGEYIEKCLAIAREENPQYSNAKIKVEE